MKASRRGVLLMGGGLIATLAAPPDLRSQKSTIEIRMQGRKDGSHVWFDPIGVHVSPGQPLRWINLDPGNAHTSTAYHPLKFARPLRIPDQAQPWDSDYLLPNESFALELTQPGVYDYYCQPHEHAGMVGRIVVGTPPPSSWSNLPLGTGDAALPEVAVRAFPSVEEILQKRVVRRS